MIAIPNMEKPKSCVECHWYYELYDEHCTLGKFLLRKYATDASEEPYILNVQRHPDCPLIEIVRCGECMHYTDHDCPIDWESLTVNDFCSYGERRTDE